MDFELNKIYCGDAVETIKTFPDAIVDTVVTSPPYFGLRDYGVDGQIGLEKSPKEYIDNLVSVFREIRRVLKDDGTLWVNLGDSYNGYKGNAYSKHNDSKFVGGHGGHPTRESGYGLECKDMKPKDLIGIPWMFAFAMRDDGWYLRQDIIWCLSGGTYLYVKSQKGVMPMMIKDLIRLDHKKVKLWNGTEWVNVLGWGKSNDTSNKVEIELRSGERIQCTGGHKWVLEDGTEKTASELKVGDVLLSARFCDEGSHHPSMLTPDVLWVMGLWLAEGSKADDCIQLALNGSKIIWIDRIRSAIESVGGTVTYTLDGNSLNVRIYSQVFIAILHQYIGGRIAKDKHLNNICWQMPNEYLRHFITGYLDGDGHYDDENNRIRIGFTRNYDWERDLRVLANRLGATITLKPCIAYIGEKKFPSFRGEWRWNVSNHFNNKSRSEIVAIRNGRGRNFYDISVDCDNHLFALASGVLTHNCKPNPMPESVTDRCTKSHEYIFLFSKSEKYYFDHEAIQEKAEGGDRSRVFGSTKQVGTLRNDINRVFTPKTKNCQYDGQTPNSMHVRREMGLKDETYMVRNKRDVWTVNVEPYKGAHFATYPQRLISPCIQAGSRAGGVVLDPFMGSGTTAVVARKFSRKYIGVELNPEYIKLAETRIACEGEGLFSDIIY